MPDYKRIELLVKVAKLYYENDYSQEMIAKKLGLSRPYISKLLNESKSNGIVKVQVIDPLSIETPLEKNLREHFGLEKVRIVPMSEGIASLSRLGLEAARYLDTILQDGDIIGLSWGATVYECSKALIRRDDLRGTKAGTLCGEAVVFTGERILHWNNEVPAPRSENERYGRISGRHTDRS